MNSIKQKLRSIPNFPKPGILFRDITPVWQDKNTFKKLVDDTYSHYKNHNITKVIGIESRGFVVGSAVANLLNAGFVPVRKPGRLPGETIQESYVKEYGSDVLEIHKDALCPDDVVLIQDDLLATGGTVSTVINLCKKCGVKTIYVNCTVELSDLNGRENIHNDVELYCPIVL